MKTAIHSLSYCACLIVFAFAASACSDEATSSAGPRCGDGICSSTESPTNCNRDCSFECIPEATRCVGNTLVTCLDDGMHEDMENCESGQVCAVDQCVAADSLPTPDVVESDATGDSSSGDVAVDQTETDAAADETSDAATDESDSDQVEDTATDPSESDSEVADDADDAGTTSTDTAEDGDDPETSDT